MRYFVIAGEASGDLHASNLIKEIRLLDPEAVFEGFGGDKMREAGMTLKRHYKEIAFMGFVEVIKHLSTILNAIKQCKEAVTKFEPDALILVDYPGFNLRIAEWAKQSLDCQIHYYISPQVWAWKEKRAIKIKAYTDRLYCILPFEPEFYKKYDLETDYVGHPLLDELSCYQSQPLEQLGITADRKIIALLPGSRKQEISKHLPIMLEGVQAAKEDYEVVIAGAPGMEADYYQPFLAGKDWVHLVQDRTYDILSVAYMALVSSGTATLETALFLVPQIVCYKGNQISFEIAKRIVNVDYIALVNLILDRPAVKELIQGELTAINIQSEIDKLASPEHYQAAKNDCRELQQLLNKEGASSNVAKSIFRAIKE